MFKLLLFIAVLSVPGIETQSFAALPAGAGLAGLSRSASVAKFFSD